MKTEKFLRQRRFYMILPVLTIPFLTIIFWVLGGGEGKVEAKIIDSGINTSVPGPALSAAEGWNKLSLYEQADRDSAEFREKRESDPYFDLMAINQNDDVPEDSLMSEFRHRDRLAPDHNEIKVQQKLDELYKEISKASQPDLPAVATLSEVEGAEAGPEILNFESGITNPEADPELSEISQMVDKLLLLQNPPSPEEKPESRRETYRVERAPDLCGAEGDSIIYRAEAEDTTNIIEAVIHNTQTLVPGAVVRLRLVQDITIKNIRIPKDQLIYGISSINGERLIIKTETIRKGGLLLPVSLSVYDLDGLEGIYIPGAIARDAAKQASDDAISNLQFMSMDQSLQQQAAAAGLEATKGLFSKKAKQIKVKVKAGYRVLLLNTNY